MKQRFLMRKSRLWQAGNPLIKEKMQLENDVQRLKLLKSTYDSQKYSLEDNITIRFPN